MGASRCGPASTSWTGGAMKRVCMGWSVLSLSSCLAGEGAPDRQWTPLPSPVGATVAALSVGPTGTLCAGSEAGLFVVESDADAWRLVSPPDWVVSSVLAATESIVVVGTYRRGIWRSEDGGDTWLPAGFDGNSPVEGPSLFG